MLQTSLAIHETLQVRELLTSKTVCLTKSKTMQPLVSDQELKTILQNDVQNSTKHIQELQGLLSNVSISS